MSDDRTPHYREHGAHGAGASPSAGADTLQVACFGVDGQDYALDIMRIKEIINPVHVTRVPNAPDFVEGLIELRGAFMAVIDLRKRFGVEPMPLPREGKYIVVMMDQQILALMVDRVIDVRRVATSDIRPAPDALSGPRSQLVTGVVKKDDRIVMIIDLDAILSPAERDQLGGLESQG